MSKNKVKSKGTARVLIFSVISIFVCCALFAGATFAWFRSGVVNKNNRIKAGSFDVSLWEYTSDDGFKDISSADEEYAPLFDIQNFFPGDKAVGDLYILNESQTAIKYDVRFKFQDMNDEYDDALQLKFASLINIRVNGSFIGTLEDCLTDDNFAIAAGGIEKCAYADSAAFVAEDWQERIWVVYDSIFENVNYIAPLKIELEFDKTAESDVQNIALPYFDIEVYATQYNDTDYEAPVVKIVEYVKPNQAVGQSTQLQTAVATVAIPNDTLSAIFEKEFGSQTNEARAILSVTLKENVADISGLTVTAGKEEVPVATIDLSLVIGTAQITDFGNNPITVKFIIAKGLDNVTVVYEGAEDCTHTSEPHPNNVKYNKATGELSFETCHFSEFQIVTTVQNETINAKDYPNAIAAGTALRNTIVNAVDGAVIYVGAGTYDIYPASDVSYQNIIRNFHLPIVANNIKIVGVGDVTLTSTKINANGAWDQQNFITVIGNNVTLKNFTIMPKASPNKSIEVLGKDVTLKDLKIMRNTIVTKQAMIDALGEVNGVQDWELLKEFSGSVYFSPNNAAKDIGNAVMENVFIDNSGIACSTASVAKGKLLLKNVTIDVSEWYYAGVAGWGVMSKYDGVITTEGGSLTVIYSTSRFNTVSLQTQIYDRIPAGAKVAAK